MNNGKKALVCAPVVPEYDRESGSRRIFHLVELLIEAGWSVTFISQYRQGPNDERYLKALRQKGVLAFAGMDSSTHQLLSAGRFDIAIIAFWYLAQQCIPALRACSPHTRIIVDSIDLHFLREARQAFHAVASETKPVSTSAEKFDPRAVLRADPNPVPESFGPGETRISWDTGNGQPGSVCVSVDGLAEKIFAEAPKGSETATWIAAGSSYEFRLYSNGNRETVLARLKVAMETANDCLGPTYASRMMQEVNTYALADGVLTVSQKEADLINDLIGDPTLAHTVPDFDDFKPSRVPMQKRKGILFVGNFKHAPNIAAVEYLCREVVPKLNPVVLAEHPLYVVGNALDEKVLKGHQLGPNIHMIGWVPSVVPYLEQARISVVPLTYGAGTKRKLLHALMVGSPVVSTSVGIEGLNLKHEEQVLVADDPESFAASITRLLNDVPLWRKLSRRGRAHALAIHGREAARESFLDVVRVISKKAVKVTPRPRAHPAPLSLSRKLPQPEYQSLLGRIREAVAQVLPPQGVLLVVSKGDDELLQFERRQAWHFPRTDKGAYAGHHPANSEEAIAHLEALRAKGAEFLLLPQTAFWWLDHYSGFKRHLEEHCSEVFRREDTGIIYSLLAPGGRPGAAVEATVEGGRGEPKQKSPRDLIPARLVAFYLPQFYPTAENNEWWGEGFTEWTNVAKARPLFDGHHQPCLPGVLGFYDLRVREVRQAQADLARTHGIEGFCYWHYWFHGRRLLERPFEEVLHSGEPDFPFCLSWANETWSRRWHGSGGANEILKAQTYSTGDDIEHARWLVKAFSDPRYLKVNGRAMFLIYRASDLPDSRATTDVIRSECVRAGLSDPYLIGINSHKDLDYRTLGFDATLDFEPQLGLLPGYADDGLKIYDYVAARQLMTGRKRAFPVHPCIFARWDNTPRRGRNGIVFTNSTPEHFQAGLAEMVCSVQGKPQEQRLVFINAWNEWAEGNYLEPDSEFGDAYLRVVASALNHCPSRKRCACDE